MKSILSTNYFVHFDENAYLSLGKYLSENFCSKIFILVDNNTKEHCLPLFQKKANFGLSVEIIDIKAG